MKQKLSFKEYIYVASMLFGMFFGAGNLIFPVYMGQVAGRNMWAAVLGFLITGVGLPLLGVAALGISRSNGLFDLSHKVGRPYAFFFTCALYLTIGPFFAIPRCATTSFTVGLEQILPHDDKSWLYLLLFSLLFFAVTLVLSLRPGKILTYVGKVLTPCFLVFLAIMVFVTILHPTTSIGAVEPQGAYAAQPFFTGCAETFVGMFPKGLSYRNWVFVFTGISFLLANVGLTAIITYAVPVLMFLYPLAITLILLALLGHFFDHDRAVYAWVTGLTLVAAFYDLLRTLPDHLRAVLHVNGLVDTVGKALPFATIGLGWICPAILGLVIGLIFRAVRPKKA